MWKLKTTLMTALPTDSSNLYFFSKGQIDVIWLWGVYTHVARIQLEVWLDPHYMMPKTNGSFGLRREREKERMEESRVKLTKNKLILNQFYFTVYSTPLSPNKTKHKRVQTVILGNKIPPKNRPQTGFPSTCMPVWTISKQNRQNEFSTNWSTTRHRNMDPTTYWDLLHVCEN